MNAEQLLEAAKKLKKQLTRANEKNKKLEERFIKKVKETKQANQLVIENEKSIEDLEKELGFARDCLNKVFAELPGTFMFDSDCRISADICNRRFLELKSSESQRLEQIKQQAFLHATQNSLNTVQNHQTPAQLAAEAEQQEIISIL